jgi:RNA polymerase sigma-70 factor (ECF subfamily)
MSRRDDREDADTLGGSPFERAFRRLFDDQFPSLFRYLDRLTGDPDLAADLAQEAFVRLYQRGTPPDDVRAWLASVASNLLRDDRRRDARRGRILEARAADVPLGTGPEPADAAVVTSEQRGAVRRALDRLPVRDRQILLLRHEGYSYREIAQAVGVAESGVGTLLARATAAFRRAFDESGHAAD